MASKVERIASHLQGAAAIRRWTIDNIPFTESALGYDLFIKIGSDSLAGLPLNFKSLRRNLPYPDKQIRQHLARLIGAGLLAQEHASPSGAALHSRKTAAHNIAGSRSAAPQHGPGADTGPNLVLTPRFTALLNAYVQESDRVYAVRQNLRGLQLLVADADADLQAFVERLYDHFHDLGWMYLHNFGAICFLMASLVCRVARNHGYRARVISGYVEIIRASDQYRFVLGGNIDVAPGQIAGHAFCVIEESLIVDFGLGNVRRAYHRDFPWAVSCAFRSTSQPRSPELGSLVLANGDRISWKDDWQYPETAAELSKFEGLSEQLVERYRRVFGDEYQRDGSPSCASDSGAMPMDQVPPANLPVRSTAVLSPATR